MEHDDRCDRHDANIADIRSDLRMLCARVPEDLKEELVRIEGKMNAMNVSLEGLHKEFGAARNQWRAVVMVIVTLLLGAIMKFVLSGGLKGGT